MESNDVPPALAADMREIVARANTADVQMELGGSMFQERTQPKSEAIGLLAWRALSGRGPATVPLLANLASGAFLLLAARNAGIEVPDEVIEKVQQRIAEMMPDLIRDAVDQVLKAHQTQHNPNME